MSWRHPTTILREEFAARGVLPSPPRGQRTEREPDVFLRSEKRDGRWYSWPEPYVDDPSAYDRALGEIAVKYGLEVHDIFTGVVLAWPQRGER